MSKTIEQYFADWEGHVIGFGYGTGEPHTLAALKSFMEAIGREGNSRAYDYEVLEKACRQDTAWLLISILCRADIIEYGTSPRYGWLTDEGAALCEFIRSHTVEEMVEICCGYDEDYHHCYPDHCNCDEEKCSNPFWEKRT